MDKWVTKQKEFLVQEKESEREESVNSKYSKQVAIIEVNAGISGRSEVKFAFKGGASTIQFKTGEAVQVRTAETKDNKQGTPIEGVVTMATDKFVVVSLDEFDDCFWEQKILMAKVPNETTFKRMDMSLSILDQYEKRATHASKIVKVAFNDGDPQQNDLNKKFEWLNPNLNATQHEAIDFALSTDDIALILGPPGTGKTTTVVEIIRQAVKLNMKLLVCGPSNISIDNIVEKLSDAKQKKMVRLGHPARIMDSIIKHSLDYQLLHGESSSIVTTLRKDIAKEMKKLSKRGIDKRDVWKEIRTLRKELREFEKKSIEEIIDASSIVLTTCSGAMDYSLKDKIFDLVIIDEAAQALEASCWIPLLKGRKCILAGDPFQLPPTILCENIKKHLQVTLFERLYKKHGEKISRMLTIQYRMNEEIMKWSSKEFYKGKLEAHDDVKSHLLTDLKGVQDTDETITPLFFIDTSNCGMNDADLEGSKENRQEAEIVLRHVTSLVDAGLEEQRIAIITPYSAQVAFLKDLILPKHEFIEIGTVDGFQGREKDAIIISMVRSNDKGEVGFLSDERRTNVAVTRAKRHVCIVGDSVTLRTNKFLSRMTNYFNENADVRNGSDYQ